MAKTFDRIATTTLTATASSISFTSISNAYTDLQISIAGSGDVDNARVIQMQFNSDTGSNYGIQYLIADSSGGRYAYQAASQTGANTITIGGNNSTNIISINSYTSTSAFKNVVSHYGLYDASNYAEAGGKSNTWRSTAAISSILFYPTAGWFDTATTITIYGITAANA